MNYNQFLENYKPIKNHLVEGAALNGTMFETYGEEFAHIRDLVAQGQSKRIWTYVAEGDSEIIMAGVRFVNRLGYIVTEKESESDEEFVELM